MELVISKVENVQIRSIVTGSRDVAGNFLLSLSHDARADYLITGDLDLLVLKITGSTQIVTLSQFLETLPK